MIRVIKYIFSANSFFRALHFVLFATSFQLFKRLTGATISRRIFNGKKLFLYPNCNVSTFFVYTDRPDKKEIGMLRSIIAKEDVFLDIGANVGSYSICLMDLCDEVIAFEPHPFTARRCKMNFLLNGKSESSVVQVALSSQSGKTFFSDIGHSSTVNSITTDSSGISVDMLSLDEFMNSRSDLSKDRGYVVKIDVEGFEKQVLLGAGQFLSGYRIKGIILECFQTEEVFGLLREAGFTSFERCSENNFFISKQPHNTVSKPSFVE